MIPVIMPKVQMAGYSETHKHLTYVALNDAVNWRHRSCNNQTALLIYLCSIKSYSNKYFFRVTGDKSAVSLLESTEQRYIKAINKQGSHTHSSGAV